MSRSNLVTISLLCGYAAGAMVTAMIVIMGRATCNCHELEPELELSDREPPATLLEREEGTGA